MKVLEKDFYQQQDVFTVAQKLLGKGLFTKGPIGGIIVETEAYAGIHDRACHVYGDRRTKRVEAMYGPGGHAYVYKCYGIHHLINAVTGAEGVAEAVLIRALIPTHGIETMISRRGRKENLTSGPGTLCQALGITLDHYSLSLDSSELWICDLGLTPKKIEATPRIGVDYAGADALLPYRYTCHFNQ